MTKKQQKPALDSMIISEGERRVFGALTEFNPWWQGGKIEDAEPYRRQDFYPLKSKLDTEKIIALIGARQVGKTTLLRQIIEFLLTEAKVKPKNILYAGLDDPKITAYSREPLEDIIRIYQEYVIKENLVGSSEKRFIFFDEIQKIGDWSVFLKSLVDKKVNAGFLVSGSSSALLYRHASETLPGRHVDQVILPFKFLESVKFRRFLAKHEDYEQITLVASKIKDELKDGLEKNSAEKIYEGLKSGYFDIAGNETELKGFLNDYIVKGGYPDIIKTEDARRCYSLFQGYLSDIILKDVQPSFQIRDPELMSKLVFIICNITSQKLNVENVKRFLGEKTNRITVERYLSALEKVYFISLSQAYTKRKMGTTNLPPKIYVKDIGFRNGILGKLGQNILLENPGPEMETIVFDHCQRLCFDLSNGARSSLHYWSNSQTNKEVDIIMDYGNHTVPLEVKYANEIKQSDIAGLKAFMEEFKCDIGFVITKDKLAMQDSGIIHVPAWLFLTLI